MHLGLVIIVVVIASAVGTITGFGTSTIMVPVMLVFYPAPETLLFVGIIHWFGNLWKVILFKHGFRWKITLTFGLPGILASFLGALLMFRITPQVLSRALGAFIIAYVIYLFAKSSFKVSRGILTSICGGAASGFMAGVFGIGGAVRALFLSAFDLPKAVYISTAGAIALAVDTTRLTTYLAGGAHLESIGFWILPPAVIASFLGAKLAKRIVDRIPQARFRTVIAGFLLLIALKLLIWPT
ncbi:MAG TPA: sulfite exporter TauE/SafE family protein [Planctomycetes bacterium]|nr:sulfite exporter TauE/SafE family protein [Planctomycetota bacterium]